MSAPTLLGLPPELRNQIYRLMIGRGKRCYRIHGRSGLLSYPSLEEQNLLGITRVCQQLRDEVLPMILELTYFSASNYEIRGGLMLPYWGYRCQLDDIAMLGPGAIQYIRSVTIYAGTLESKKSFPGHPNASQRVLSPAYKIEIDFVQRKVAVALTECNCTDRWDCMYDCYSHYRHDAITNEDLSCDAAEMQELLEEAVKGFQYRTTSAREVMETLNQLLIEHQSVEYPLQKWYELTGQA